MPQCVCPIELISIGNFGKLFEHLWVAKFLLVFKSAHPKILLLYSFLNKTCYFPNISWISRISTRVIVSFSLISLHPLTSHEFLVFTFLLPNYVQLLLIFSLFLDGTNPILIMRSAFVICSYDRERVKEVGADRAAAEWIVRCEGKVKFVSCLINTSVKMILLVLWILLQKLHCFMILIQPTGCINNS